MKLKILVEDQYIISAIMDGDSCPIEDWSLLKENSNYNRTYLGLIDMLQRAAKDGLQQFSSEQSHLINDDPKIYEFVRGRLRLIYFHGVKNTIVVGTEIVVKKTQKSEKKVVSRAINAYENYYDSVKQGTLIEVRED
jgi:hypothetical protein